MVSFLTWRLTVTAVLLVTPILTVLVSIALETAGDTLSTAAFHQTLAVTGAIDLIRLVHAVMVTITDPLNCNAAPIPTAMLFRGVAITVLLITQVPTVIISITHQAVIKALACVAVKLVLAAVAMRLIAPVITVVVAIALQFPGDTESTGTQKALAPSAEHLLSIFLLWREANPAGIAAFGLVSKLRAFQKIRPGGVHHPQDGFTAAFCSLTKRSTGQEATAVITINDALGEGEATAK